MKVNTAISFVCLGAGLWLAGNEESQRIRRTLGLLVVLIGGATLAEYTFHISLGIDQLLFRDTRIHSLSAYPGRMAISTATCFLLLGSAIMALGLKKGLVLQRSVVAACFTFSVMALCGYLYGVKPLYSITSFSTIGVHTSAALMAVCVAYFLARPGEGIVSIAASESNAGLLVRTLLPAVIVVPILFGWLALAGERANLYDPQFAVALLVLGSIGCLTVLAMLTARSTHRLESERWQAQNAVQQSERLLKIFVKNVPAGVAMFDREMRYLQVSDRLCAEYSVDSSQIIGRSHYELFPDIPERWKATHRRALEGEILRSDEDRWDRAGGTTWVRWEVRPWHMPDKSVGGILIFAEDITERKQMQEALSGMAQKLIEAQEQERARIGRELHDDINQRLAMLAVDLEQLPQGPPEFNDRMRKSLDQITEIARDVQTLSHELHFSKLEYLGVVGGIKSWCREFSERQRVEIDFKSSVAGVLPLDVGVPLFRVLQEALHNAFKHSGVKRIEVQLEADSSHIQLRVSDLGRGFDVEAAMRGEGLGLTSMRERIRLAHGTITIESKPRAGTSIHVVVPFQSEQGSQRTAV